MQKIVILDFGSQYTQLIARKIREMNVYCEIFPYNKIPSLNEDVKGVILSGSPCSVNSEKALVPDLSNIKGKYPMLAICYGAQYLAKTNGGNVIPSTIREYGRANLNFINSESKLMKDIPQNSQVWMSHGDTIESIPANYKLICSTSDVKYAGYESVEEKIYGIQFHPETTHSIDGKILLKNFVLDICQCENSWKPSNYVESKIAELKALLGNDKVILGLSGGVDSTVAGVLLHRAIGQNLHCIFVNHGLLRKNEFEDVLESYKDMGLNVRGVDASKLFLGELKGVTDPEKKRKIIGKLFIDVFDTESHKIEDAKWLGQGTIYPDVIESAIVKDGHAVTIKSHHNVGGLPDYMKLKIVEPLRDLFKDEVRRLGEELKIKPELLYRHPFPGPGLAIRLLGEITEERVSILQEVDHIYINGLKKAGLYNKVWQAGAILLPVNSVGVMGDERTYEQVVALRAVESIDGMTADWSKLPYEFLAEISNEIINKVKGVNRVVYDISSKPPATIEWE